MKVMLAPMEGVVDHLMRDMLTRVGGFDQCVTEFVSGRSKDTKKTFYRLCPELHNGKNSLGVPVSSIIRTTSTVACRECTNSVELGSPGVD